MLALHFKNFLTLLYKLNSVITIYCENNNKLVCSDTSDTSITYQFEFESSNLLIENKTYIISLPDIHRLFKYIKSSSLLFFTQTDRHLLIRSTHENIVQELKFPKIIGKNTPYISTGVFSQSIKVSPVIIRLNDLSRMIKALKNTSDNYLLVHNFKKGCFTISNIDSIIPVSYTVVSEDTKKSNLAENTDLTEHTRIISNYTLLRLNKLYCDNSFVKISNNFIYYYDEEISYYLSLNDDLENLE